MSTQKAKSTRAKKEAKKETKPKASAEPTGEKKPSPLPPPGPGIVTTGTGAPPMVGENDPAEKKARANMPIGIRSAASGANTSSRVGKGKKATSIQALIYRGLEILRGQTGHVKSPEYLELEKDLGFGPK